MATYRLYFLDRAKHIHAVTVIDADSDEAACAAVPGHDDGRGMELWLRDRLVRAWAAPDQTG